MGNVSKALHWLRAVRDELGGRTAHGFEAFTQGRSSTPDTGHQSWLAFVLRNVCNLKRPFEWMLGYALAEVKPKHSTQPLRAFTLIETLMMLVALGVLTLTTLAVLKKDQFSAKVVWSKFASPAMVDSPAGTKAAPSPSIAAPRQP